MYIFMHYLQAVKRTATKTKAKNEFLTGFVVWTPVWGTFGHTNTYVAYYEQRISKGIVKSYIHYCCINYEYPSCIGSMYWA
jgi:hypothetical protein